MEGFQRINEQLRQEHYYLKPQDECYYLLNYKAGAGADYNKANRLIYDYKTPPLQNSVYRRNDKLAALRQVRSMLLRYLPEVFDPEEITLVPVPPSKTIASTGYDDRNWQVLRWLQVQGAHVLNLLFCKEDMQPAHIAAKRPALAVLKNNLLPDTGLCSAARKKIVLFDDMLTSGAHYTACKELLQELLPETDIAGAFIARRALQWEPVYACI